MVITRQNCVINLRCCYDIVKWCVCVCVCVVQWMCVGVCVCVVQWMCVGVGVCVCVCCAVDVCSLFTSFQISGFLRSSRDGLTLKRSVLLCTALLMVSCMR